MRLRARPNEIDLETVDRLLSGLDDQGAPPRYTEVAALLRVAAQPPAETENVATSDLVTRLAAKVRAESAKSSSVMRKSDS
jgi:hypothetical protein